MKISELFSQIEKTAGTSDKMVLMQNAMNTSLKDTPRKDLRKQIHKHEQPPAIYTDNQQGAEIVVFLER